MKRVTLIEEGNTTVGGGRSQADIALGGILAMLEPPKKRAATAMQQWMHENWKQGANLRDMVSAKWDKHLDKSVTKQPPQFRLNVVGDIYETLSEEEKERWLVRAKEKASKGTKDDGDSASDPVAIAA